MTAMLLCLALTAPATAQVEGFVYVKRDTREASREATLAAYLPALELDGWHVIGPFDNTGMDKHDVVYPPELGVDLAAAHEGKGGRTVTWEAVPDDDWSFFDLKRFGPTEADNEYGVAYLHRTFRAARAGDVGFEMGSDDGLKVWLNGKLYVDADVYRGMNIQDHILSLPVQAGENTLLVKVTQGVGGWDFQMRPRVSSRVVALLDYHLNRDFPESREYEHYRPLSVLEPEDVVLEVGGLDVMPDGRPIVTTRRGEVWIVDGAYEDPPFGAEFTRFAFGLHESLGGMWHDGGLLVAQRGELTHLLDTDGDDRADVFRTVSDAWGVSGNYHEFAFGPEADGQGRNWVTLNVGFCGSLGKSIVPWRGWAVIIEPDGGLVPVCGGLRSPNGIGRNAAGDMFATDNQGDWVGTNKLMHLDFGDWHGHPAGDQWYEVAGMDPPTGEESFKPPAIWFPYDRMGRSASDILLDDTGGAFGPFEGQLFVGDQYAASVMRVDLEQVGGVYQGACFPFISGLDCGVNRMCWAPDGSMLVGMTNRGWWSFGSRPWGLQRIVYTGAEPFEIRTMRARPDGFELTFTKPVDPALADDPARYAMARFTHHRWVKYGSEEIERAELTVRSATVQPDGRSVRLVVDGLRPRFVHELVISGVKSAGGETLLHDEAYYTLNVIPAP
jgi:hypothetical protein